MLLFLLLLLPVRLSARSHKSSSADWPKEARVVASIACPEPMGLDRSGKTLDMIHDLRSPRALRTGRGASHPGDERMGQVEREHVFHVAIIGYDIDRWVE
ncbi:hypothetical protein CTA1_3330 [Colletotrichum tanaceti]|uniref:Secreted protein n=1 Tax=Colletotrichum tanaceti TaxID=1306861 RepID=A0A4U6X481_9PEZI|nr:hypothetical protein CTA1_3330 [Colletotrichum tanaceti]